MATCVLTSYTLIPELQHWFNQFVIGSEVNRDLVPPPADIAEQYMPENSFIEMLFNDNYSEQTYDYRYKAETNMGCIPYSVIPRLQIYPGSWQYLTMDESGDNVFGLTAIDFTLLDALLAYRQGATDSTSLIMIDSTSVSFVGDATAGIYILYGSYDALNTELSKLIYLYLRLETLDDFSLYNNESLVTSGGLLETCFESYLIDKYFAFMTAREPDLIYDCEPCD
jgi:hypothetical protein